MELTEGGGEDGEVDERMLFGDPTPIDEEILKQTWDSVDKLELTRILPKNPDDPYALVVDRTQVLGGDIVNYEILLPSGTQTSSASWKTFSTPT